MSFHAMARVVARVIPLFSRSKLVSSPSPAITSALGRSAVGVPTMPSFIFTTGHSQIFSSSSHRRSFHTSYLYFRHPRPFIAYFAAVRGFRNVRWRQAVRKRVPEEKKVEFRVKISIEEGMPDDHEITNIVELLKLDAPVAMKMAFDSLKELECRPPDSFTEDISKYEKIELSILLCNDEWISNCTKEWKGSNCLTNRQHARELEIPILMLGDMVISAEAAARKVESAHTFLDEIRILMIQGLLQLLGFDNEIYDQTSPEMENLERLVLGSLNWKGRALTKKPHNVDPYRIQTELGDGKISSAKKAARILRFYQPKFSCIFCSMDGTLLNSEGQVTSKTAEALRESLSRGVKIVIATGKTRPAVISKLKMVDLDGKNGIVSEVSPGIFLQGMLVYGRQGREIYRRNLDPSVTKEALLYSIEHEVPLIAFCEDRCWTLFDHPLVDSVHSIYHEPKAEIMGSVEHLLSSSNIQKIIFLDTVEGISSFLRPHWEEAIEGRACIVQAQPNVLEIIPSGTSIGDGVQMLLDHLGISAKEIMAVGGGENDAEMLKLASLGVALGNGSEKAKASADVVGATNDEDGVAMAIYEHAF